MFMKLKNNHSGFVLYETVVSLLVAVLTLGILQQSLQILHSIQQTTFRDQLRWHVTQEKLQEILSHSELIKVSDNQFVYEREANERMVIGGYANNTILRKTTATRGGYEPIMTNLNKINIEKIQNLVIITTENKAGQKSQMCIINDP